MEWLTPERYAAELEAEAGRLGAAASGQDADAIVPTCPEWTVRDLVTHVGSGHRFAAEILETGAPAEFRRADAPSDQEDWPRWLLDGARRLNTAVASRGFDGPAWSWHPRHQTAGFWLRRMVHDQVVHRFDADPHGDLAPDLAADGVADLLLSFEMFELRGDGETLLFTATDLPRSWHVTLTGSGITWTDGDHPADVAVAAPAQQLLLTLNRRLPSPAAVRGDTALWERWREGSRF